MRLAVLGSVGSADTTVRCANGGHDVAFVARRAHLEALQQRGLYGTHPEEESTIHVTAVADTPEPGSPRSRPLLREVVRHGACSSGLPPLMARDTAVVALQNGVDNVEAIGSVVGSGQCSPARSTLRFSSSGRQARGCRADWKRARWNHDGEEASFLASVPEGVRLGFGG
jgi:2-dehydropantoate 2-reductase